jgi:hypothetical protein
VFNAPFSADATTTVRQTLSDGTRIERSTTAHFYRDRAGRVRVEQMIIGLEGVNPAAERQVRITVYPDPTKPGVFTLDPSTRTASQGGAYAAGEAIGGWSFALPLGGPRFLVFAGAQATHDMMTSTGTAVPGEDQFQDQPLGSQRISGVEATGRRITTTVPAGHFGNDRPIQIVDERWESPELKLVVYSRNSDPRTGVVEYRLTNIRRVEPPADLFVVPADYTIKATTWDDPWISLVPAGRKPKGGRGGGLH